MKYSYMHAAYLDVSARFGKFRKYIISLTMIACMCTIGEHASARAANIKHNSSHFQIGLYFLHLSIMMFDSMITPILQGLPLCRSIQESKKFKLKP